MLSHAPPKDIRISVNKLLFENYGNYANLPDRMIGTIDKWTGGGRAAGSLTILTIDWEADKSNSVEFLAVMLQPRYEFKLERYANGKMPPRAKGLESQRRYVAATTQGPYAGTYGVWLALLMFLLCHHVK